MGTVAQVFLDWTRPLVEAAAERLHGMARGDLPADFSHLFVVVPTAEASRQLRLRVAELCANRGGAMNLQIALPDLLPGVGETAGPEQVLMAWRNTLTAAAEEEGFSELFRNDVLRDRKDSDDILFGWGEALQSARTTLAREGLSLADAAAKLDAFCRRCASEAGEGEYQRFLEFEELEKRYLAELEKIAGKRPDPAVAALAAMRDPHLPEGVETVVLIDCADLAGAPECFLDRAAVAVECWINAPEGYAKCFDRFGRPLPEYWNEEPIELDFKERLRLVPRPDQQAKKIFGILAATDRAKRPGAVGVLDPEVAAALETRAELAGGALPGESLRIFVPREVPFAELPWSRLLLAVIRLIDDDSVAAAEALWREPLAADYFRKVFRVADTVPALTLLDKWRQTHFVADAQLLDRLLSGDELFEWEKPAAAALARLAAAWKAWRADLKGAFRPLKKAYEIFAAIGGANELKNLDFQRSDAEVSALRGVVASVVALSGAPTATLVALLKRLLGSTAPKFRDEPQDAVAAVGFLELPWRSENTLLIAGFNEGCLSPAGGDDLFLPDSARAELGMITREKRHAADILRFKALNLSHRLFILCGQQSQSGERLFPARLLFQCADPELPARVKAVFVDRALIEDPASPPVAAPPFSPRLKAPGRMSITGFSAYLASPYKFYIERVLGAGRCDPEASEMDDLAFGTFAHKVLQECQPLQSLPEPEFKQAMLELFRRVKLKDFGPRPPGLAELQCAILEELFEYFVRVQHAEYEKGWRIVATELQTRFKWSELYSRVFPEAPPAAWRDEVTLSGKIDRIDRMDGDDGVILRVLDYKTSAKAKKPKEQHVVGKYPEWADEELCLAAGCTLGKNRRPGYWTDLQLPLYVLILRHILTGGEFPPAARIEAGYFNLPLDLTSTGVSMFAELNNGETLESAARCADGILRRIFVDREFSPDTSDPPLELFPDCEVAMANFRAPGWRERKKEGSR